MKHKTTTLLAAATLMASSSLVHAEILATATLAAGAPATGVFGFGLGNLNGSGELAFSDDLIGALAVAGIQTSVIAPASGTVSDTAITIGAPVATLSGLFTATAPASEGGTGSLAVTQVSTLGGATMVAPKANFATSGGALSVSNISVDLSSQGIYATVSGANGLATQTVRVWDYTRIEGDTHIPMVAGTFGQRNTITGLKITDEAFDLFAQGLGLKAGGIAAMASISDYGVMTSSIFVDSPALSELTPIPQTGWVVVPEPSTYLMMGLGLVGLSLVARRQRAA